MIWTKQWSNKCEFVGIVNHLRLSIVRKYAWVFTLANATLPSVVHIYSMPQGQAVSEDLRWAVVHMSLVHCLSPNYIASLTGLARRTIDGILTRFHKTGHVMPENAGRTGWPLTLGEENLNVRVLPHPHETFLTSLSFYAGQLTSRMTYFLMS